MAEWHPIHQPLHIRSGLEAGGQVYDPPLLPYEIALIEALGCSEEEYKAFVRYARDTAHVRPAEYEHIPDIQNIFPAAAAAGYLAAGAAASKSVAAVVATNIAIGVALIAASILLAPKAPALESPAKIRGKKLADQIGPTRFNQTTAFDNVSSLAEYNQPIPIPFGKPGTGSDNQSTGGLVIAPSLVWSRLYSYGTYQAFEGIYVTGEYGIQVPPALAGIRIDTTALDNIGDNEFALYWSSNRGNNRPTSDKFIAGNLGEGTNFRNPFTAPTRDSTEAEGFSMTYNPQGDTSFGTATPIHNGTGYRFNWEIVSAPFASTEGEDNAEARAEAQAKRRKIAGGKADVLHLSDSPERGQPGVGREYSRRMGLVTHIVNGVHTSFPERTEVNVAIGDKVVFKIFGKNWREFQNSSAEEGGFAKTEVNLKDLKNSADSWRARASDLLIAGSRWIIHGSIFIVESRDFDPTEQKTWVPGATNRLLVVMRCVGQIANPAIGFSGDATVVEPLGGYDGGEFNARKHCGPAFYTLCRLHQASIRPVRRDTEVIEIGIRSQVWNRAAGLCNFNALPSAQKLYRLDRRNITLNTPKMDKYFDRTSCFTILARPVQDDAPTTWNVLNGCILCVTGRSPVDVYNFIRIKPGVQGYYEYRLVPLPGSLIRRLGTSTEVMRLDAASGNPITRSYTTQNYGSFEIATSGAVIEVATILGNDELNSAAPVDPGIPDPAPTPPPPTPTPPAPSSVKMTTVRTNGTGDGRNNFKDQALYTHMMEYAPNQPNQTREFTFRVDVTPTKSIAVKVSLKSLADANLGGDYYRVFRSQYRWQQVPGGPSKFQVISFTGEWRNNEKFQYVVNLDRSNPMALGASKLAAHEGDTDIPLSNYDPAYSSLTVTFAIRGLRRTDISSGSLAVEAIQIQQENDRIFEDYSQIADCSYYQELQKSNENGPEHEVVYINECTSNEVIPEYTSMSMMALSIKSSGQLAGIGQLRAWIPSGINVYRLIEGDGAPSNLFADLVYYLLTSTSQGVGNIVSEELIDRDSLVTTARFLRANKIFFDGVVEDTENLRSFLYDNAALQLCNFTIKNGRFGMMPALPYDSNYLISDRPIAVEQIFTAGNIIADSLQVQYIDAAQRSNFRALVSWRVTVKNDLPSQASALVDWADIPESDRATTQQAFDLTDFCTNRAQALRTARFLLSVRRRITHTVSFKTVPDSLGIQPGSYIRVITSSTTYSATGNGIITFDGQVEAVGRFANGVYRALVYKPSDSSITEVEDLRITNNRVADERYRNTLFTILSETVNKGVYQVEQLTLDEDGLVNVSAVEVPVDDAGASIVAKDVLTESNFRVLQ
jgi:hypothetical protein